MTLRVVPEGLTAAGAAVEARELYSRAAQIYEATGNHNQLANLITANWRLEERLS